MAVKKLEIQLWDARRQMENLLRANDELRRKGKTDAEELQKVNKRVEDLSAQNNRWEAEAKKNAELASQIPSLQDTLTENTKKLTSVELQLRESQLQYEALEQAHRVEQTEHLRIETERANQISQLEAEASAARGSLQQFEEANRQLQAELYQQQTDVQEKESLQKEVAALKQKLLSEEKKCAKLTQVNRAGHAAHKDLQAHSKNLQMKYDVLVKEGNITEKIRRQIIQEYRASPELTEEIIDQFAQGYQAAKAKLVEAGADPKSFGFSDDEDDKDDASEVPGSPNK